MTLIAFAACGDHAEIMADSIAYDGCSQIVYDTAARKVTHLPRVAGAVATQGSGGFARWWADAMAELSAWMLDFDEFTAHVERTLVPIIPAKMATAAAQDDGYDWTAGVDHREWVAFHIGYSPAAGRFVAYGYLEVDGRVRRAELDGLYVMPAPMQYRPGPVEQVRTPGMLEQAFTASGRPAMSRDGAAAMVRDMWMGNPAYPVPATAADWAELATVCHRSRSLECPARSSMKVLIGGDVNLMRLSRDSMTVEKIHEFSDPDEFATMVAGTMHPLGQVGPCWCESGRAWVDCHATPAALDKPCGCGKVGRRFGECCYVHAGDQTRELALAPAELVAA